jgi:hypothetical protein
MKKKKTNPIIFAFIIPIVGALGIALALVIATLAAPRGEPLDLPAYLDDWHTVNTGKTYALHGVIVNQALRKSTSGTLIIVRELREGTGTAAGTGKLLPIFIPAHLRDKLEADAPLAKDQRFNFHLRAQDDLLVAAGAVKN